MTERRDIVCCVCGVNCWQHHFMCDEEADKVWCPTHFTEDVCEKPHGEGCATQVLSTKDEVDLIEEVGPRDAKGIAQ